MADGEAPYASIGTDLFARAMQCFAPYESEPKVAVGVSGGPDSMALLLLLDAWARSRGGSVLALTVDHGLRADSAEEARQVAAWAHARGIANETLSWVGDKPASAIQSAARDARYALLAQACAAHGILNLAVAHHADDQAETVLFRRDRDSGQAGLAGMPASRSLGAVRLIRPLLGWSKPALIATCNAHGQRFIDDPSNRSGRFARTELRRRLADETGQRAALLGEAATAAGRRAESDAALARLLGRIAEIRPYGVVMLDRSGWADAEVELRRAALAASLRCVGGGAYAPDRDAILRLESRLLDDGFAGVSLGGCIVRGWRDGILFCREPKRAAPPVVLADGQWRRWDNRFLLRIDQGFRQEKPVTVGVLGARSYAALKRGMDINLPSIVGTGLPAVRSGDRLIAVPSVGWAESGDRTVEQRYLPLWSLSSETFTVVYAGPDIMSA
jgi:tRNA(Ile)-lysidine synthase